MDGRSSSGGGRRPKTSAPLPPPLLAHPPRAPHPQHQHYSPHQQVAPPPPHPAHPAHPAHQQHPGHPHGSVPHHVGQASHASHGSMPPHAGHPPHPPPFPALPSPSTLDQQQQSQQAPLPSLPPPSALSSYGQQPHAVHAGPSSAQHGPPVVQRAGAGPPQPPNPSQSQGRATILPDPRSVALPPAVTLQRSPPASSSSAPPPLPPIVQRGLADGPRIVDRVASAPHGQSAQQQSHMQHPQQGQPSSPLSMQRGVRMSREWTLPSPHVPPGSSALPNPTLAARGGPSSVKQTLPWPSRHATMSSGSDPATGAHSRMPPGGGEWTPAAQRPSRGWVKLSPWDKETEDLRLRADDHQPMQQSPSGPPQQTPPLYQHQLTRPHQQKQPKLQAQPSLPPHSSGQGGQAQISHHQPLPSQQPQPQTQQHESLMQQPNPQSAQQQQSQESLQQRPPQSHHPSSSRQRQSHQPSQSQKHRQPRHQQPKIQQQQQPPQLSKSRQQRQQQPKYHIMHQPPPSHPRRIDQIQDPHSGQSQRSQLQTARQLPHSMHTHPVPQQPDTGRHVSQLSHVPPHPHGHAPQQPTHMQQGVGSQRRPVVSTTSASSRLDPIQTVAGSKISQYGTQSPVGSGPWSPRQRKHLASSQPGPQPASTPMMQPDSFGRLAPGHPLPLPRHGSGGSLSRSGQMSSDGNQGQDGSRPVQMPLSQSHGLPPVSSAPSQGRLGQRTPIPTTSTFSNGGHGVGAFRMRPFHPQHPHPSSATNIQPHVLQGAAPPRSQRRTSLFSRPGTASTNTNTQVQRPQQVTTPAGGPPNVGSQPVDGTHSMRSGHNVSRPVDQMEQSHTAQQPLHGAAQGSGDASNSRRQLKVEDALAYLEQVKTQFDSKPEVYNQFLDIMKEFKAQTIDTTAVIRRVSDLFVGHEDLILGFNTFLPPGYEIRLHEDPETGVRRAGFSGPEGFSDLQQQSKSTEQTMYGTQSRLPPSVAASSSQAATVGTGSRPIASGSGPKRRPVASPRRKETKPKVATTSVPLVAPYRSDEGISAPGSSMDAPGLDSRGPGSGPPKSTAAAGTGSNHATTSSRSIVKSGVRLANDVADALNTNQRGNSDGVATSPIPVAPKTSSRPRELAPVRNKAPTPGVADSGPALNGVGERVRDSARLDKAAYDAALAFMNRLNQCLSPSDFNTFVAMTTEFMEHPFGDYSALVSSLGELVGPGFRDGLNDVLEALVDPRSGRTSGGNGPTPRTDGLRLLHSQRSIPMGKTSDTQDAHRPPKTGTSLPNGKARTPTRSDGAQFFADAKAQLGAANSRLYSEFVKCIRLFSCEIISRDELVGMVSELFRDHPRVHSMFLDHLEIVTQGLESGEHSQDSSGSSDDDGPLGSAESRQALYRTKPISEIAAESKVLGTSSYKKLPSDFPVAACSGRSTLEKKTLNDVWVSVTTGSEDYSFKFMRRNPFEENLFRCEDDRYELDLVIETNAATILKLEPIAATIAKLPQSEKTRHSLADGALSSINFSAIERIYGDIGPDIVQQVKLNPAVAVPVVLRRLRDKDNHWRRARVAMNAVWREVAEKNYHRSLDHRSQYFKQVDKKDLNSKSLLADILNPVASYNTRQSEMTRARGYPLSGGGGRSSDRSPACDAVAYLASLGETNAVPSLELPYAESMVHKIVSELITNALLRTNHEVTETARKAVQNYKALVKAFFGVDVDSRGEARGDWVKPSTIVLYGDESLYVFFRLHHLLFERLTAARDMSRDAVKDQLYRSRCNASGLQADSNMSPTSQIEMKPSELTKGLPDGDPESTFKLNGGFLDSEKLFDAFMSLLRDLLSGRIDGGKYEDKCRVLLGVDAYCVSTIDKTMNRICKQVLNVFGSDSTAGAFLELFHEYQYCLDDSSEGAAQGTEDLYVIRAAAKLRKLRGSGANLFRLQHVRRESAESIDEHLVIHVIGVTTSEEDDLRRAREAASIDRFVGFNIGYGSRLVKDEDDSAGDSEMEDANGVDDCAMDSDDGKSGSSPRHDEEAEKASLVGRKRTVCDDDASSFRAKRQRVTPLKRFFNPKGDVDFASLYVRNEMECRLLTEGRLLFVDGKSDVLINIRRWRKWGSRGYSTERDLVAKRSLHNSSSRSTRKFRYFVKHCESEYRRLKAREIAQHGCENTRTEYRRIMWSVSRTVYPRGDPRNARKPVFGLALKRDE